MGRAVSLSLKSPLGIIALIMMALNNSFISAAIFGGIGRDQIVIPTIKAVRKKTIDKEIAKVIA